MNVSATLMLVMCQHGVVRVGLHEAHVIVAQQCLCSS